MTELVKNTLPMTRLARGLRSFKVQGEILSSISGAKALQDNLHRYSSEISGGLITHVEHNPVTVHA